ncbi:MAG: Trp biosynthesis-associated membrane protein [Candidatus Limnocylindrales bacterium]
MTAGTGRRELFLAVAGCLTAAAILMMTSGQTWLELSINRGTPLPAVQEAFNGADVAKPLMPIAIIVGAAALALVAGRGAGRLGVGVVLILGGTLILVGVGYFLSDDGQLIALSWVDQFEENGSTLYAERDVSRVPAAFALLGAGLSVIVGAFTLLRGRKWPVMGARYERRSLGDSPNVHDAGLSAVAMWAAMDRGEDPTSIVTARADETAQPTRDEPVPPPSLE